MMLQEFFRDWYGIFSSACQSRLKSKMGGSLRIEGSEGPYTDMPGLHGDYRHHRHPYSGVYMSHNLLSIRGLYKGLYRGLLWGFLQAGI